MLVHDYSSALFDLLTQKKRGDEIFVSLKSLLKKKGHEKLYTAILKDLSKKMTKSSEQGSVQVIVGRKKDIKDLEDSILKAISSLGSKYEYTTQVDPTIIGGFKIISKNKVIDQSYKKQLLTIYRSLTT